MPFEQAINQLRSPRTWCQAAEALVSRGDRRALLPLIEAYETPIEGGKRCLLEAMAQLGARDEAQTLFEKGDAEQRWRAVQLMRLFESDRHLPALQRALADDDAAVREEARVAIVNQEWTDAWEAAMIQLLESDDPQTRALAVESLTRRDSDTSRAALQQRGKGRQ
jgi:HEAT repeat protein